MAQEIINVGTAPNDGLGDPIRDAYIKCNDNFDELYSRQQTTPPDTLIGTVGDVAGMYAYDENYFYYCYANYDGSSQIWGQISEAGNVAVSAINNGTSNVSIPTANGDVEFKINGVSNVVVVSSSGIQTGNITANNVIANTVYGTLATGAQPNITSVGTLSAVNITGNVTGGNLITSGIISATGNITGGNLTINSAVVANSFTGDGSGLTGVTATGNVGAASQLTNGTTTFNIPIANGNVVGNINGTTFVYVFTETGANVSGYVNATGNVTGGNLISNGSIVATGNIDSGNLSVSGTFSTSTFAATSVVVSANITGGNLLTGGVISASGNVTGGNVIGGGVVAISNITGGNLSVTGIINSTGNITGGNLITGGLVSVAGNITAGNISASQFTGNATQANTVLSAAGGSTNTDYYIAYLESVSGYQVPKTDTGLLFNPSTNKITANTVVATTGFTGTLTGNVSGNVSGTTVAATGNVSGGNLTTGGQVVATGNVTGGNLKTSGVTVSSTGITASGILTINSSDTATAIVNGGSNAVGNIGSASKYFNTVFATASTALYADLAECYLADADYEPGTVLSFGGSEEVTVSGQDHDPTIAGVVSTKPAYQMNSGLQGTHVVAVALTGRVPCRVQGPVTAGAMMVSAGNGRARAEKHPAMGTVIGKAVASFDGEYGVIEVVVGRL
jgi:hypothetical protein